MIFGALFGKRDDERGRLGRRDWQDVLRDERVGAYVDSGGRASLFRRGVLLVATTDLGDARLTENLDDLGITEDEFESAVAAAEESGDVFAELPLGQAINVVSASRFLRGLDGRQPLQVGPDHYLSPAQGRLLGPAMPPEKTDVDDALLSRRKEMCRDEGIPVAVLDSGLVDTALGTDPLLGVVSLPLAGDAADTLWDAAAGALRHWEGGHGTHVAGVLAASAAGQVRIAHHNVATETGPGGVPLVADSILSRGIRRAVADGARILNLSLAGPAALDLGTLATALALAALRTDEGDKGVRDVVVVAAAGNEATAQPMFPAAMKGVIGVASYNPEVGHRSTFSNYGPWVDCAAAGDRVVGPYVKGKGGPLADGTQRDFEGWARWSGTSFAAPQVAGRIAEVMASGVPSARVAAAMVIAGGANLPPAEGVGVFIA